MGHYSNIHGSIDARFQSMHFLTPSRETTYLAKWLVRLSGLLLFAVLVSCGTSNYYVPSLKTSSPIALREGKSIVLFSNLVRKVNVSRSQGRAWISRRSDEQADSYSIKVEKMLRDQLKLQLVNREKVLDHDLYLAGKFPLRLRFFLNPNQMPIIKDAETEELMLRTSRALGADYYAVLIVDHSITKILFQSASVTSEIYLQIYSSEAGLISQTIVSDSRDVLPYDLPESGSEFYTKYSQIIDDTLTQSMETSFAQLEQELAKIEIRPAK